MGKCWLTELLLLLLYLIVLAIAISLPLPSVEASDRCVSYVNDVRIAHTRYFGPAFPYWYGVAQLRQESGCRDIVTALDGGMGVAQFMPRTAKYLKSLMGETLNPYDRKDATRMQAYYMAWIHKRENWIGHLWISYQIYNGGRTTLYSEYKRAGKIAVWHVMRAFCIRKAPFCDVNYDYSRKIAKYGDLYRRGPDSMRFW